MREKIFRFLSNHATSATSWSGLPLSASNISHLLKISYYKCLKGLHELREQGLVRFERFRHYDDYAEEYHNLGGWVITDKGEQTDMYKEEDEKNVEMIKKSFPSEMWGDEQ